MYFRYAKIHLAYKELSTVIVFCSCKPGFILAQASTLCLLKYLAFWNKYSNIDTPNQVVKKFCSLKFIMNNTLQKQIDIFQITISMVEYDMLILCKELETDMKN